MNFAQRYARDSTLWGVVSTRDKSGFVPGLLQLMRYGRSSGKGAQLYPVPARRNARVALAGLFPTRVTLALRAVTTSQCA